MNRFFVWLASLAVVVLLIGCAGGGLTGGGNASVRIYIDDSSNARIVRMDDMAGTNWTTMTQPQSKGSFGTSGLCIRKDSQGRLYVMDSEQSILYRFSNFDTSAEASFGSLGSGTYQFDNPFGIAFDSQGRIYVADSDNNRIVRFDDMAGTNWVTFGSSGSGTGQFSGPYQIAIDSSDRIYVCDAFNHRIVRFDDMSGTNWTTFGTTGTGTGQFESPIDIFLTTNNKMLIADRGGRVILTDLMSANNWQEFQEDYAQAVAMDPDGRIYVVNQNDYILRRYDNMTDTTPETYGSTGSGQGQFDSPSNILVAP